MDVLKVAYDQLAAWLRAFLDHLDHAIAEAERAGNEDLRARLFELSQTIRSAQIEAGEGLQTLVSSLIVMERLVEETYETWARLS